MQQFNIVKLAQRLLLVVIVFLCGMTAAFAADARWTDGTSVAEGTLAEMMAKVNQSGGTVILLQDYTYSSTSGSAITANKSFTLDLNGKTLTSKSTGISVTDKADGITTIKNGTIIASRMCVAVKGGALKMDGITAWSDKNQNVSYYVTTDKYNKDNLIENCTFANAAWGAFSFNNVDRSMDMVVMTVKNSDLITSKTMAVVLQDAAAYPHLVVGEGVNFYATSKPVSSKIAVYGEEITPVDGAHTVTVLGHTLGGLTKWSTPTVATVKPEIPDIAPPLPLFTYAGTCGENLYWTLDAAGTLTVSGTGAMQDYCYPNYSPWDRNGRVKNVIIGNGVTSVGNYAFYGCTNLQSVVLPGSINDVGDYAFGFCHKLESITVTAGNRAELQKIQKKAVSFIVHDGITALGEQAFYYCYGLCSVTVDGDPLEIKSESIPYQSGRQNVYYNGTKTQWCSESLTETWLPNAEVHCLQYEITYHANGGTAAPEMQIKPHGKPVTLSTVIPTHNSYTFLGWTTGEDATVYQPGETYTADGDTTLYAVWEQNPVLVFPTVTDTEVRVDLRYYGNTETTAYLAGYGQNLLAVSGKVLNQSEVTTVSVTRLQDLKTVKLMVLDENLAPLGNVQYIALPE